MALAVLPRIVLVAAALLACAWLAQGLHVLDLQQRALDFQRELRAGRTPPGGAETLSTLRSARRLNADPAPLFLETSIEHLLGHHRASVHAARRLVAAEPDNYEAWLLLLAASRDRRDHAEAVAELDRLNPLLARTFGRSRSGG